MYEELTGNTGREGWPAGINQVLSTTFHVLFQVIIVHLDMIKQNQGVSLYRLVEEARAGGNIDEVEATELRAQIDAHSQVLKNVGRQRNYLIAHRNPSMTFKEIKDAYPVTTEELRALSLTYYSVALRLHQKIPFNKPWELVDHRSGVRAILRALDGQYSGPRGEA